MGFFDRWADKPIKLTDGAFWRGFFGLGTTSGEIVNYDTALALDAVWACVGVFSRALQIMPCNVYEKDGTTMAENHPLYELLHDMPNMDDTASDFWGMVAVSLCIDGNFFAEKKMNGERLVALVPLHPLRVEVKRNSRNARVYDITEDKGKRTVAEDRMLHIRGMVLPGWDRGLSPIGVVRNTIGNALAAEKTAGKMFAGGMQAAGVLTSDQILKPEQRKQLGEVLGQFAGSERAGKIAVLEAGLKYQQLTVNPEDAQMLETRQFGVEQVCRIFGVPPIMVGHAAAGVTTWGSGVEQILLQFTKTGLQPMLKSIESAIYRDILTSETRKKLNVKFNMDVFLRGDSKTRAEFLSQMVNNGIYTRAEARKYETMPLIAGSDELTAQGALLPLNMLGKQQKPPPAGVPA